MYGRAYYERTSRMLLALDTTVEIAGSLADPGGTRPLRIVYRRTIAAAAHPKPLPEPATEPTGGDDSSPKP